MKKRPARFAGRFFFCAVPNGYLENEEDHQAGMTAPEYFSVMYFLTASEL